MSRQLYSLLLYLALPFVVLRFLWKEWPDRACLPARLGIGLGQRHDHPLWVHAASVGEVRSLATLLRQLHRDGFTVLLTVGTATGLAQARVLYDDLLAARNPEQRGLSLKAAPWDLPGATRRFVQAVRPGAGVIVETELWPNLLHAAHSAGIPMGLVSARLSERSVAGYRRWAPRLMRATVRAFMAISAQSPVDRERFVQLGADPHAVEVGGSLKTELFVPPGIHELADSWQQQWAAGRPLWVAGSTHAGEEAICVAAQRLLLEEVRADGAPAPLLVLAPRHPQRFDVVARELAAAGVVFARSSRPRGPVPAGLEVLLVDEMGTLLTWYAAGAAAFVGGSLVDAGGHNLLEPAVLSKPVLAGPHHASAPDVARCLREAGGLAIVNGAEDLARELRVLLCEPQAASLRGARACAAMPEEPASRAALEVVRRLVAARSR